MNILDFLFKGKLIVTCEHVGSRVTCSPPPTNTDDDYLVLVNDYIKFDKYIIQNGFNCDSKSYAIGEGSHFVSYRLNEINLIVTNDNKFFKNFVLATRVTTMLNLQRKEERIELFQSILYKWDIK